MVKSKKIGIFILGDAIPIVDEMREAKLSLSMRFVENVLLPYKNDNRLKELMARKKMAWYAGDFSRFNERSKEFSISAQVAIAYANRNLLKKDLVSHDYDSFGEYKPMILFLIEKEIEKYNDFLKRGFNDHLNELNRGETAIFMLEEGSPNE